MESLQNGLQPHSEATRIMVNNVDTTLTLMLGDSVKKMKGPADKNGPKNASCKHTLKVDLQIKVDPQIPQPLAHMKITEIAQRHILYHFGGFRDSSNPIDANLNPSSKGKKDTLGVSSTYA